MTVFPDWEKFAVVQRYPNSGCIPTSCEMMLRAADVQNVAFESFQDDFDLDKNRGNNQPYRNNFTSVTDAISSTYPHVRFTIKSFPKGEGQNKLAAIEGRIAAGHPVLISLANSPFGGNGCHIMPVVDSSPTHLALLVAASLQPPHKVDWLSKKDLVRIHDSYSGGDDIAYLASV